MSDQGKGPVKEGMERKIREALQPTRLIIVDESHRHAGHGGHHPDGESHFHVEVVSAAFAGKSRLDRHRLINSLLADELSGRVHALAVTAKTPEEAA